MDTQDWTTAAVVLYLLVLAAVSLHAFLVRRSSVFEPIGLYLFFVTLFALPLPLRYCITTEIEGNVSPLLPQFAPHLPFALLLTALSLPVFAAGYYSGWAGRLGARVPLPPQGGARGTGWGIAVLLGLSMALIYLLTESVGGLLAFVLLGYKSSEETFGRGYLAVGFPWLVVGVLALLDRYAALRSRLALLAGVLLALAVLAVFAITGNRNFIMYLGIALALFIHWRIRPIGWRVAVPVALAGFLALNVLGAMRSSDYGSLEDFQERTLAESEHAGREETLFYTLTVGEFVVPFETLPQMIRMVGTSEVPWMGASFARAPVYLIPSFLVERPLPIANWYMERFYGAGYGLNEGRAFFFLAEGYLNFGPLGVLLVSLAWGVLWGGLHAWMQRGRERFGTVLVYALVVAFMYRCIAGDVVTLMVGIPQQSLAAVFLVLAVAGAVRLLGRGGGAAIDAPPDPHRRTLA